MEAKQIYFNLFLIYFLIFYYITLNLEEYSYLFLDTKLIFPTVSVFNNIDSKIKISDIKKNFTLKELPKEVINPLIGNLKFRHSSDQRF